MSIRLNSSAFDSGGVIPRKYTCDGEDISPAVSWDGVPREAESLVLVMDDPDAPAGTWTHWVAYEIPPDSRGLPERVSPIAEAMEDGMRQGMNDFKKIGYGGACPPPGGAHRYHFRLYALRKHLDLPPGATKAQVEEAMSGWVLDEGELMGTYSRRGN